MKMKMYQELCNDCGFDWNIMNYNQLVFAILKKWVSALTQCSYTEIEELECESIHSRFCSYEKWSRMAFEILIQSDLGIIKIRDCISKFTNAILDCEQV